MAPLPGRLTQGQVKIWTPDNEPFLAPLPRSLHKSQHTKYPSQTLISPLHYLPFASHFPLPHFTLPIFRPLSPSSLSFSIRLFLPVSCLLVCRIACLSRWLKIIPNCVTLPIPTTMILLALRFLLLPMLNLVK